MEATNRQAGSANQTVVEQVVGAAPDAVIVVDGKGVVVHWNGGAQRIFGFSAAEALGQNLDLIIPERLRERHWTAFHEATSTGTSRYGPGDLLAVPAVTKDGARISVEFSVAFVRQDGVVTHVGAIMRDVTRRRADEIELRRRLAEMEASARDADP
jgi:PAS domain S-box-containing protein